MTADAMAAPSERTPIERNFHESERIRDVPASCICTWAWSRYQIKWLRKWPRFECPWHSGQG